MALKTPKFAPIPSLGGSGPHTIKYMVPWAHPNNPPKRYHDPFSLFSFLEGLTNVTNRQTDRHHSVCSERPHLGNAAIRPTDTVETFIFNLSLWNHHKSTPLTLSS